MTYEAKQVSKAFDARMLDRLEPIGYWDMSDEVFAEYRLEWIGTGLRTGADDTVYGGADMHGLLNDLDRIGHPPAPFDWTNVLRAWVASTRVMSPGQGTPRSDPPSIE